MTIDLLKQDNKSVEERHKFLPSGLPTLKLEELLKKSMTSELAHEIVSDAELTLKLQKEFEQIL